MKPKDIIRLQRLIKLQENAAVQKLLIETEKYQKTDDQISNLKASKMSAFKSTAFEELSAFDRWSEFTNERINTLSGQKKALMLALTEAKTAAQFAIGRSAVVEKMSERQSSSQQKPRNKT